MKATWIYIMAALVLLAVAVFLSWPLFKGPHSIRQVCSESAQLDSAEATLTEITDSLSAYTQLDSLTFANLFGDEILKTNTSDNHKN